MKGVRRHVRFRNLEAVGVAIEEAKHRRVELFQNFPEYVVGFVTWIAFAGEDDARAVIALLGERSLPKVVEYRLRRLVSLLGNDMFQDGCCTSFSTTRSHLTWPE